MLRKLRRQPAVAPAPVIAAGAHDAAVDFDAEHAVLKAFLVDTYREKTMRHAMVHRVMAHLETMRVGPEASATDVQTRLANDKLLKVELVVVREAMKRHARSGAAAAASDSDESDVEADDYDDNLQLQGWWRVLNNDEKAAASKRVLQWLESHKGITNHRAPQTASGQVTRTKRDVKVRTAASSIAPPAFIAASACTMRPSRHGR